MSLSGAPAMRQGFLRIVGRDFEHLVQTPTAMLGRESKATQDTSNFFSLGNSKLVSRKALSLEYNLGWQVEVLAKKGVYVDGERYLCGQTFQAKDNQFVVIADIEFFLQFPRAT